MEFQIPQQCSFIIETLNQMGYEAYLVGGCVRDRLLGHTPVDWDICTSAYPQQVKEIFSSHRVIETGIAHGTVTILIQGMSVEVTTYRIDGEYLDCRRPKEVQFTNNLKEDLSRRDFTINALAYHPQQGVIDYFGGIEDLNHKVIRCVGDAYQRYQEDGLRLMRAIRFACVLDFEYELETKKAIIQCNYLLRHISMERIQIEFNKIILSPHIVRGLKDLYYLGCFSYFLPEICHTYGFEQNNPFHCYDVFYHTIKSAEAIEPLLVLRLTMVLHDISKPFDWCSCYGDSDCFPKHEEHSSCMAKIILKRMRYDNKTIQEVSKLIQYHVFHIEPEAERIRYTLAILGEASTRHLLAVKIADLKAQRLNDVNVLAKFEAITQQMERVIEEKQCYQLQCLDINGEDLKQAGFIGKEIGMILQKLLEQVLKDPEKNDKKLLLKKALQYKDMLKVES